VRKEKGGCPFADHLGCSGSDSLSDEFILLWEFRIWSVCTTSSHSCWRISAGWMWQSRAYVGVRGLLRVNWNVSGALHA